MCRKHMRPGNSGKTAGLAYNSDQDWPLVNIPPDLGKAGKTRTTPGSPGCSQGPKTVTFGATIGAEFQVEKGCLSEEEQRGKEGRHAWPQPPQSGRQDLLGVAHI